MSYCSDVTFACKKEDYNRILEEMTPKYPEFVTWIKTREDAIPVEKNGYVLLQLKGINHWNAKEDSRAFVDAIRACKKYAYCAVGEDGYVEAEENSDWEPSEVSGDTVPWEISAETHILVEDVETEEELT